jgi:hypothetical protein
MASAGSERRTADSHIVASPRRAAATTSAHVMLREDCSLKRITMAFAVGVRSGSVAGSARPRDSSKGSLAALNVRIEMRSGSRSGEVGSATAWCATCATSPSSVSSSCVATAPRRRGGAAKANAMRRT